MPVIIDSVTYFRRFEDAGCGAPDNYACPDGRYIVPTKAWVKGPFSDALWKLQVKLGIRRWVEESNDCDDFARTAAAFAQILHARSKGRPADTALAIGEFWYYAQRGVQQGYHAICAGLWGPKAEVFFYEPQTCQVIELTDAERKTCKFIRL